MAKENKTKQVTWIYGEETFAINIRVPKSKVEVLRKEFQAILKKYQNPKIVEVSVISKEQKASKKKKSNPADEVYEGFPNRIGATAHDEAPVMSAETKRELWDSAKPTMEVAPTAEISDSEKHELREPFGKDMIVPNIDVLVSEAVDKPIDTVALLKELANPENYRTDSVSKSKKPLDEEYDFEIANSLPNKSDRIFVDKQKGIAFFDMYDDTIFYVVWENQNLMFRDKDEFDRFLKDKNIK